MNRLEDVDVEDLRKRGARYAEVATKAATKAARKSAKAARKNLATRVRPQPRRRVPMVGILVVGAAAIGIGYLLYDRGRREAIAGRVDRLQHGARERYAELGGFGGAVGKVRDRVGAAAPELDEAALEAQVREVVAAGGKPVAGVKVTVEGRTVYLRGAVDDPGAVDATAERVHGVDGVVAVVNLTTTPARAGASNNKK
jgi:hypothetical protein